MTRKTNSLSRRNFLKAAAAAGAGLAISRLPGVKIAFAEATGPVQFWDMVWGPPEYIDSARKLVDQFNKANPGIQVTYQSTPWSSWPQVFTTAIGSGSAPEISTGGGFQAVQYYPEGAILELNDVVDGLKKSGKDKDFLGNSIEKMVYGKAYTALPWGSDIRTPYYRKDLFEKAGVKAPTNWDELRTGLKKLTSGNQYGIAFAGNSPLGWQQMLAFVFNNGGGLFTEDGKLDVLNDRNVEALTFLADLVKDGSVHPGSAGFTDADMSKAFSNGSAAMTIFQPGFEKRVPDQAQNTGLLAPLTGPHGDKGTLIFVNNIMMYKDTKNPEAAKVFLNWWLDNMLPLWTEGHCGLLPGRASIAKDDYFQKDPNIKLTLEQWVPVARGLGNKNNGVFPLLGAIDGSGILNTFATDLLQSQDAKAVLQKAEANLKTLIK
jgi:multiple sugar transport system substrate-binding protein